MEKEQGVSTVVETMVLLAIVVVSAAAFTPFVIKDYASGNYVPPPAPFAISSFHLVGNPSSPYYGTFNVTFSYTSSSPLPSSSVSVQAYSLNSSSSFSIPLSSHVFSWEPWFGNEISDGTDIYINSSFSGQAFTLPLKIVLSYGGRHYPFLETMVPASVEYTPSVYYTGSSYNVSVELSSVEGIDYVSVMMGGQEVPSVISDGQLSFGFSPASPGEYTFAFYIYYYDNGAVAEDTQYLTLDAVNSTMLKVPANADFFVYVNGSGYALVQVGRNYYNVTSHAPLAVNITPGTQVTVAAHDYGGWHFKSINGTVSSPLSPLQFYFFTDPTREYVVFAYQQDGNLTLASNFYGEVFEVNGVTEYPGTYQLPVGEKVTLYARALYPHLFSYWAPNSTSLPVPDTSPSMTFTMESSEYEYAVYTVAYMDVTVIDNSSVGGYIYGGSFYTSHTFSVPWGTVMAFTEMNVTGYISYWSGFENTIWYQVKFEVTKNVTEYLQYTDRYSILTVDIEPGSVWDNNWLNLSGNNFPVAFNLGSSPYQTSSSTYFYIRVLPGVYSYTVSESSAEYQPFKTYVPSPSSGSVDLRQNNTLSLFIQGAIGIEFSVAGQGQVDVQETLSGGTALDYYVTGSQNITVYYGSQVTLTGVPYSGYAFINWFFYSSYPPQNYTSNPYYISETAIYYNNYKFIVAVFSGPREKDNIVTFVPSVSPAIAASLPYRVDVLSVAQGQYSWQPPTYSWYQNYTADYNQNITAVLPTGFFTYIVVPVPDSPMGLVPSGSYTNSSDVFFAANGEVIRLSFLVEYAVTLEIQISGLIAGSYQGRPYSVFGNVQYYNDSGASSGSAGSFAIDSPINSSTMVFSYTLFTVGGTTFGFNNFYQTYTVEYRGRTHWTYLNIIIEGVYVNGVSVSPVNRWSDLYNVNVNAVVTVSVYMEVQNIY